MIAELAKYASSTMSPAASGILAEDSHLIGAAKSFFHFSRGFCSQDVSWQPQISLELVLGGPT